METPAWRPTRWYRRNGFRTWSRARGRHARDCETAAVSPWRHGDTRRLELDALREYTIEYEAGGNAMGVNDQIVERYRAVVASDDMGELTKFLLDVAGDDFVEDWPQSGERIVGRDGVTKLYAKYSQATGMTPKMTVQSIKGEGDLIVTEGTIDYGDGIPVSYVGIAEFADGKVHRLTEYFANPFPAPDWRADAVQRYDPRAVAV
jgi:hypothetical protein